MRSLNLRAQSEIELRIRFCAGWGSAARAIDGLLDSESGFAPRVAVFLDDGVERGQPELPGRLERVLGASERANWSGAIHTLPGGEVAKNDPRVLERCLEIVHKERVCRRSYVLCIGGGAVLDVVGYAAATAHRGVRLIRLPTTTLSQCDSGMGVKCGVNMRGSKNFLGAFAVPWGVVCDFGLLGSLADSDWISGFSEAIKVALVRDAGLFGLIGCSVEGVLAREPRASREILERSAKLHAEHILSSGDPFETRDARPLDFGHWLAHRIEELSGFSVPHGHAVAVGLAVDTEYAARAGIGSRDLADAVRGLLTRLGFDLAPRSLDRTSDLLEGLEQFREHLGGRLCVPMIAEPGRQVDVRSIDSDVMSSAIEHIRALGAATESRTTA